MSEERTPRRPPEGLPEDEAREMGLSVSDWMRERLTRDPETDRIGELPAEAEATLRYRGQEQAANLKEARQKLRKAAIKQEARERDSAELTAREAEYRSSAPSFLDGLAHEVFTDDEAHISGSEVLGSVKYWVDAGNDYPEALSGDEPSLEASDRFVDAIDARLERGGLSSDSIADYIDAQSRVSSDYVRLTQEISGQPLEILAKLVPRVSPAGHLAFNNLPGLWRLEGNPAELAEAGAKLLPAVSERIASLGESRARSALVSEAEYFRDLNRLVTTNPDVLGQAQEQGLDRQQLADSFLDTLRQAKDGYSHSEAILAMDTLKELYAARGDSVPTIPDRLVSFLQQYYAEKATPYPAHTIIREHFRALAEALHLDYQNITGETQAR